MVTKLGRVVTYLEELPFIKLHHPSITRFCKITWQVKYFISTSTRLMAINHGKVVTYRERLPPINSHVYVKSHGKLKASPLSQWLCSQNLPGLVTYHEELPPISLHDPLLPPISLHDPLLPPISLHDPLMWWYCRVTRQMKYVITTCRRLWPPS